MSQDQVEMKVSGDEGVRYFHGPSLIGNNYAKVLLRLPKARRANE